MQALSGFRSVTIAQPLPDYLERSVEHILILSLC